jgi:hypothetical protein
MALKHASVQPFRLKLHSTDLCCDVLQTKGYRGRCACGWLGPVRTAHSVARGDSRIHVATCRDATGEKAS